MLEGAGAGEEKIERRDVGTGYGHAQAKAKGEIPTDFPCVGAHVERENDNKA